MLTKLHPKKLLQRSMCHFLYPHDSTWSINFAYCTMVRSHGANSDKQFLQIHTYSLITYFLIDFTMTYAIRNFLLTDKKQVDKQDQD